VEEAGRWIEVGWWEGRSLRGIKEDGGGKEERVDQWFGLRFLLV